MSYIHRFTFYLIKKFLDTEQNKTGKPKLSYELNTEIYFYRTTCLPRKQIKMIIKTKSVELAYASS